MRMRRSIYTIALFFIARCIADVPNFTNTTFNLIEGQPLTLKFTGCTGGCKITLQSGSSTNLRDVQVITASTSGDSYTFTPSTLSTGTYNFKITRNSDGQSNYSPQFQYKGSGGNASPSSTTTVSSTTSPKPSSSSTTISIVPSSSSIDPKPTLSSSQSSATSALTSASSSFTIFSSPTSSTGIPAPTNTDISTSSSNSTLSPGAIAGIVIGSIAGVGLFVGLVFLVLKYRRLARRGENSSVPVIETSTPELSGMAVAYPKKNEGDKIELEAGMADQQPKPVELQAGSRHDVWPTGKYELDT